jgi:hypothetical protein
MKRLLFYCAVALVAADCEKDNEPTVEQAYYFKVWNKTQDSISVGATIYTKSNPGAPLYNYDIVRGLSIGSKTEFIKINTKTPVDIEECMLSAASFFSGEFDWDKFKVSAQYNFIGMDTIFIAVIDTVISNAPMYHLCINTEKW